LGAIYLNFNLFSGSVAYCAHNKKGDSVGVFFDDDVEARRKSEKLVNKLVLRFFALATAKNERKNYTPIPWPQTTNFHTNASSKQSQQHDKRNEQRG
jgi:hypothetical protein